MPLSFIKYFSAIVPRLVIPVVTALVLVGCSAADPETPETGGGRGHAYIHVRVNMPEASVARQKDATTRAGSEFFGNFDNEEDKWGIEGENMESLRVIVINGDGFVEHNNHYDLTNAIEAGEYEYRVVSPDTKTILLFANEEGYSIDNSGMEIAGGVESLPLYFESLRPGAKVNVENLKKLTIALEHNSIGGRGLSFKTPLPISAIYTEEIAADQEVVERDYVIHRAAVKYSFRIVNRSKFNHTLEKIRIDRIADREFMLPDADWEKGSDDRWQMTDYRTPKTAREQEYVYTLASPLNLPTQMTVAVEAVPAFYVPEGLKGDAPQRVTISLDGQDLDVWKNLLWLMPGETQASPRPMVDLPRNSHVVVNITIEEDGKLSLIADVQPYTGVKLDPWYGLDRDKDGNIIIKRYEDGTYDVIDSKGDVLTRDPDGDLLIQYFEDKSILCKEVVLKDYIHGSNEVDYEYIFEKDRPGGNMVIIREKTTGGTYHGDDVPEHKHGPDDRPLFVLDKNGAFYRVVYDEKGRASLTTKDIKGDEIVQANGFQFRQDSTMKDYLGTYIVRVYNAAKGEYEEELRWYEDGSTRDWPDSESQSEQSARRRKLRSMARPSVMKRISYR